MLRIQHLAYNHVPLVVQILLSLFCGHPTTKRDGVSSNKPCGHGWVEDVSVISSVVCLCTKYITAQCMLVGSAMVYKVIIGLAYTVLQYQHM